MARPKKEEHERRTASTRADLTMAEKNQLRQQAELAGLTEAEYVRRRALGYRMPTPIASRRTDPALISELNRCGVNVNQLARATHTGRDFVKYWQEIGRELESVLDRIVEKELSEG